MCSAQQICSAGSCASMVWTQLHPTDSPPLDSAAVEGLAYDSARSRAVLLHGTFGSWQTWEWDGANWAAAAALSNTYYSSIRLTTMAYDAARELTVLYTGDFLNTTFVWNGATWTLKTPAHVPGGRQGARIVYDSARQRVVLFGGTDGTNAFYNDTWEWDGTDWTNPTPTNAPSPRASYALGYDSVRGRVVLYGGYSLTSLSLSDTWEWDGTDWTTVSASSTVPNQHNVMAFDAHRKRIVMLAGGNAHLSGGNTWEWDGDGWTQIVGAANLPPRNLAALTYDVAMQQVLLFGGRDYPSDGGAEVIYTDTWRYGP
jgi:hypothetical protein